MHWRGEREKDWRSARGRYGKSARARNNTRSPVKCFSLLLERDERRDSLSLAFSSCHRSLRDDATWGYRTQSPSRCAFHDLYVITRPFKRDTTERHREMQCRDMRRDPILKFYQRDIINISVTFTTRNLNSLSLLHMRRFHIDI